MSQETTPENVAAVLAKLARLPADATAGERWNAFTAEDDPALFRLVDVAADLPRPEPGDLPQPDERWNALGASRADLAAVQAMVDHPVVPRRALASPARGLDGLGDAGRELRHDHHTLLDCFFDPPQRQRLDALLDEIDTSALPPWGELPRDAAPEIYALGEEALRRPAFRELTGFDLERDEYTLTLSRQDLDPAGIGWHRDLYWPKEWVGEDVFAVLCGLTTDRPDTGGAYVYYVDDGNTIRYHFRQRHQATVIWNGRTNAQRPLHAVSEYLTEVTARHHLHFQCHRRTS